MNDAVFIIVISVVLFIVLWFIAMVIRSLMHKERKRHAKEANNFYRSHYMCSENHNHKMATNQSPIVINDISYCPICISNTMLKAHIGYLKPAHERRKEPR